MRTIALVLSSAFLGVLGYEHIARDVQSAFSWAERLIQAQERCRVYRFPESEQVVPNQESCASSLELLLKTSALSQSAARDLCKHISSLTLFGKDYVSAASTKYGRGWIPATCSDIDKAWQRHYWMIAPQYP